MTADDIKEVAMIEKECFSVPWSESAFADELKNSLAVYFVAKENGVCAGYCGFWNVAGEGDITNIAVAAAYRRQGVGSMLIKRLIEYSLNNRLSRLTLEVRASNAAAQGLYRKFGFKIVGERVDYYLDPRENAYIMTKDLI